MKTRAARWVCGLIVAVLAVVLFSSGVSAVHLPHLTDAVGAVYFNSFDTLMPAGGGVPTLGGVTAGGPCGVAGGVGGIYSFFACGFLDGISALNTYAWETGIHNPTNAPLVANLGFFFPGGPILGTLTLAAHHTFHINIGVQDSLLFPLDTGSGVVWYAWAHASPILVDAAVIEATAGFNLPGFFTFHFHSDGACEGCSFEQDPSLTSLDFTFRHPDFEGLAQRLVVQPPAVALLAAGVLLAGAVARHRRKAR